MQNRKGWNLIMAILLCVGLVMSQPIQEAQASTALLKQGDRGGYVWDVQHRLQQLGYYELRMDGIFGKHNRAAVIKFQQRYGLIADGIVGSQTWKVLRQNTYTVNEIEMLAKAVHGEARGEPFEGKVAVAAVILNRVNSNQFPSSVKEVIFEPRAFTAVDDGQYYMAPDIDSYRAVYYAIRGWDPSGGALYYFNPDTATSSWIWSRTQINKIGKHIFAI